MESLPNKDGNWHQLAFVALVAHVFPHPDVYGVMQAFYNKKGDKVERQDQYHPNGFVEDARFS